MDLGLKDKAVIVTGASKGIGRCIALGFAEEGAHVALCARGEEALSKTAEEIAALGVKVHAETCDVSDKEALDAFLDASHAALGGADILINNTSGFGVSDDEAGWQAGFDVDVMSSVRATWKVVPWMREAHGGSVIHISSTSALEAGSPPPYAAAKAALISHSKTLANNLAPFGIRVNCVAPGSIEFPGGMWETIKNVAPAQYEAIQNSIPFGRLGTPEEVAHAVIFLASDHADFMTGTALEVNGGTYVGP